MLDYLCRRLRNRGVSDMADLAMIFVVGVSMPVADRMRGKKSQRENGGDGQQAIGDAFRHVPLNGQPHDTTANSPLRAIIGLLVCATLDSSDSGNCLLPGGGHY